MRKFVTWSLAAAAAIGGAALAAAPAQAQFYGPRYGYDRGFERHAVNACRYEAQRRHARWGGVRVDVRDVQFLRNGRIRVLGAIDSRFGRDRWDRRFDGRTAFTCEVNRNGRVSRFRTHNYRW